MQDNYQASNYHAMQPEQSGIMGKLRNHALSGLAAIALGATAVMGAKDASAQEQVASLSLQGTNLASFGIPDLTGHIPYSVRSLDTNHDGTQETQVAMYHNGPGFIAVFSQDGVPYAVAKDDDNQRPTDLVLYDFGGDQQYTPISSSANIEAPRR